MCIVCIVCDFEFDAIYVPETELFVCECMCVWIEYFQLNRNFKTQNKQIVPNVTRLRNTIHN